jgi:putative flippase GtrA
VPKTSPALATLATLAARTARAPWLAAALGGISGTVLDTLVLLALIAAGATIASAAFVGAAAGAGVCFVVNKYVAFADPSPVDPRQLARFVGVAVVSAALMAVAMHVAVVGLHLPALLAKGACAAAVFLAWSYPAQRRFVFARATA